MAKQLLFKIAIASDQFSKIIDNQASSVEYQKLGLEIESSIGRLNLQVGDVFAALSVFQAIEIRLTGISGPDVSTKNLPRSSSALSSVPNLISLSPDVNNIHPPTAFLSHPVLLMNRGLFYIAFGDFDLAGKYLTAMLTVDPQATAINNLAIAQLYNGNVGQAISFLESFCVESPKSAGSNENFIVYYSNKV